MKDFLEKHHGKIVFFIVSLFLVISLLNAKNDSATFDEVAHIPAGYSYLTQHDNRLNPEHPPLIKDLSALPLVFLDLKFDTSEDFWTGKLPNKWDEGQWAAGRHLLYQAGNNWDKIIFWSRVPIVILSVFLGLFLFSWGKEIGGPLVGLGVLIMYAFNPNILGHNHFVTTDIGVAAFLVFSFYYFLKFVKNPSWENTFLSGISLGLLLVTKFSSIVAIPIFVFTTFVYVLFRKIRNEGETSFSLIKRRLSMIGTYSLKGMAMLAFATIVIWGVYYLNTYKMPSSVFSETVEFFFSSSDSNPKTIYTNKTLLALNERDWTRPLGSYLFGPAWMFKRVSGGNGAYFLQEVGNGFTWYFPVVFVIKETLPILSLIVLSLLYSGKKFLSNSFEAGFSLMKNKERFLEFIRGSVLEYFLFGFIVLYAFLSINGGLNIGFRHLFPILPFTYLLVAKKIYEIAKESNPFAKNALSVIILVLAFWQITTTALAYPSFTSYFNESVGGPKNGYKYVTDSNTDWGQDLKRLKIYLDNHPEIAKIRVDYFGGGDIFKIIGENRSILWWDSKRPIENGWYAISANFLQGSIYDKKKSADNSYRWTLKYKPVDMIGASILIYHVTDIK